jgi:hypothetical protein
MQELLLAKRKVRRLQINLASYLTHSPDRKPVDPPPIIQLKISSASDPGQNYLQSTSFFHWRMII